MLHWPWDFRLPLKKEFLKKTTFFYGCNATADSQLERLSLSRTILQQQLRITIRWENVWDVVFYVVD